MKKIALVGYGYWGPNVAKHLFSNKKWDFCYICDKRKQRLEKARGLYANAVEYTLNYEDLINNDEIDVIALAVETSAHYELAKQALIAGKHIYVEKPFTDSVKDALELKGFIDSCGSHYGISSSNQKDKRDCPVRGIGRNYMD